MNALASHKAPQQTLWSPRTFRLMTICGLAASLVSAAMAWLYLGGPFAQRSGLGVTPWVGFAGSLMLIGLSIPAVWIGVSGLRGNPVPPHVRPPGRLLWVLPLVPMLIGLGHWALVTGRQPLIIVPVAHVLTLGIATGVTILLALLAAPVISWWRAWTHFFSGLWITSLFAILAEVVLGVAGILVLVFAAVLSPGVRELLQLLIQAATNTGQLSDTQFLSSIAFRPWVILTVLLVLGLAIPLIEELLKPIGVWLMLRLKPTQAQAFVGGVLGGAGFGLIESLFSLPNEMAWSTTVTGRIGTVGLHAFTAGLGGWALAVIFTQRHVRRGLLLFTGGVLLHGLWNISLILSLYGALLSDLSHGWALAATLGGMLIGASALTVLGLAAACFAGIPWVGGFLYRRETQPRPDDGQPLMDELPWGL